MPGLIRQDGDQMFFSIGANHEWNVNVNFGQDAFVYGDANV